MRTSTAQTPVKNGPKQGGTWLCRCWAFTLIEAMVAIAIASLLVAIAAANFGSVFAKHSFRAQAERFVATMRAAARAAAETGRKYEVIIDMVEQQYVLREISSGNLSDVLEEEIITQNSFGDRCQAVYVFFDDLTETDENHQIAKFRAGPAGWQNGGKIVLLDEDAVPYTVVVNRTNRTVRLEAGDVDILMPKRKDEVAF